MRTHRVTLLAIAGLAIVVLAVHQPATPSAHAAGDTAALVSARLATDNLAPTTTTPAGVTTSSRPATHDVALDSLRAPSPSHASGTTVVDLPSTGQSTTVTGTTLPPTTETSTTVPVVTTPTTAPGTPPIIAAVAPAAPAGGVWAQLRWCESRDNYADDTGNGYYGAYQFSLATWEGIGYTGLPSAAAPAVQDQAAQRLQARSGWGQWPACARSLGLI
jgi:hypothetical protein